jgi:hypothetical protein
MSLMTMIARLARSPQGRRAAQKAMQYANSPEGKRRIAQAREQIATRRKTGPR